MAGFPYETRIYGEAGIIGFSYLTIRLLFCELYERLNAVCICNLLYSLYAQLLSGYSCLKRLYGNLMSSSICGLN
jgi:hypothetical protein